MTIGLIALPASALIIFGVLTGWQLNRWQVGAQARRQNAAQLSLYRQLHQLQAARENASSQPGNPAARYQRRAA